MKSKENKIWVFGYECICAYMGYVCTSQLYAHTPKNKPRNIEPKNKAK